MGAGHHAVDDAKDDLGESGFRLPGEVRRMDPRREIAATCFPRSARGQEAATGGARKASVGFWLSQLPRLNLDPLQTESRPSKKNGPFAKTAQRLNPRSPLTAPIEISRWWRRSIR